METELQTIALTRERDQPPARNSANAILPATLCLTERAAAQLRAYLDGNDLRSYRIFESNSFDLNDITRLLPALGEPDAAWEVSSAHVAGGETVANLTYNDTNAWEHPSGFLRLFRHDAVIARWFWSGSGYGDGYLWLVAAPSAKSFAALRRRVLKARRESNQSHWQILGQDDSRRPVRGSAEAARAALVQSSELLDRIQNEVIGFFDERVAALYRNMGVPYRRGVLLYGPPGNGKTSLIRWIAASVPNVAAISLTAWQGFDSDDLKDTIDKWTAQAPAILVLEDLDWLLQQVNVSTFLNVLDGLSTPATAGGLLLIATTNHPEKLDPAVNNRPGRFDSTIELPVPGEALRRRFLQEKLPDLPAEFLTQAVRMSDGLSFAHLQEILRLSGLRAIHAGRTQRSSDDVIAAVRDIKNARDAATLGYPPSQPEVPFGLAALRKG